MTQSINQIMEALDTVLSTTVWANGDNEIITLAEELHIGNNNGQPRAIEDLERLSLVGAYVALQIKMDCFDIAVETLDDNTLATRVKEMVFNEAKKILSGTSINVNQRVA